MDIKQASLNEFVEILFLVRACEKDMNNKGIRLWNNINPSPEQLNEDLAKGTIYLFKELGVAKGMIKLTGDLPADFAEIDWKNKIDKPLYINLFVIHPLWQESDICEKMVEFAEIFAKENNYSGIRLDVIQNYPVVNGFFESKQFILANPLITNPQKINLVGYEKSL
jgi:hypothetical protein